VLASTVEGRLTISLFCGVGCQTSLTASTMRLENSSSVVEKDSGEYSRPHCRFRMLRHQLLDQRVPLTAICTISSWLMPNTTRRNTGATEL
jgi:hypothetical protein